MRLLPTLLLGAAACLHAEVKVTVGDIIDHRTTGKLFDSLEFQLKIVGPELAECKGVRVAIDAVDDTGKSLELEETAFDRREFRPPNQPFNPRRDLSSATRSSILTPNSPRRVLLIEGEAREGRVQNDQRRRNRPARGG